MHRKNKEFWTFISFYNKRNIYWKKLLHQEGNIYISEVYKLFECKYKKIIFVNKYGKELYTHIRFIDSKFIKDIKDHY